MALSGGVGLSAVQIAKALGASVTAVCGSASFEQVKRVGADEVIDYKTTDFTKQDKQYDLVFDCVGTRAVRRVQDGCCEVGGFTCTTKPGLGTFVRQFFNPVCRTKVFALITRGAGEELEFIKALIEKGQLKPVIDEGVSVR